MAETSLQGTRPDGRAPEDFREAFMRTGTVSRAAGSAYAEFGDTKVLVAVYGPRESKKAQAYSDIGRLNCDVKIASFATSTRGRYGRGTEEKEYSALLHRSLEAAVALHTFPKTTVDVFALILQSGGSDLAVTITCGSMALADAGIEMYDLVSAASLVCIGRQLFLDPSIAEERKDDGTAMVACMPLRNEVTQLTLTGNWTQTETTEAIELCLEGCLKLDHLMRTCLREQQLASEGSMEQG